MRACPTMQQIITQIAAQHEMELTDVGVCLCLEMEGYDRLYIEVVAENRLSVAHIYEVEGYRIPEPDVEFVIRENDWFPVTITQSLGGLRVYVDLSDDGSRIISIHQQGQADLARFCNTWAWNLIEQNWLDNAVKNEERSGRRFILPPGSIPLFSLGRVVATPGATEALEQTNQNPQELLARHVTGDWGELVEHDQQENERALTEGGRIFSAYTLNDSTRLWVITEADRSVTTLLTPAEY